MVEDDQESIWLALRSTPSDPSPLCRAVLRVVECTDVTAVAKALLVPSSRTQRGACGPDRPMASLA